MDEVSDSFSVFSVLLDLGKLDLFDIKFNVHLDQCYRSGDIDLVSTN